MKGQRFRARLSFAIRGIAIAWRRERSFRAQSGGAVAVLLTLTILRPGLLWTAAALIVIALVLALELMNAALEYLIDHLHPAMADEIAAAKDAAAGARSEEHTSELQSLMRISYDVFCLKKKNNNTNNNTVRSITMPQKAKHIRQTIHCK